MSVPQIAQALGTDTSQARRVIHGFNQQGMASLRPRVGGGRPRRIDDLTRVRIKAVALARPADLGESGTRWSLRTLCRYLLGKGITEISREHLRTLLIGMGITFQRTRTWKDSPDPCYEEKKELVLGLYRAAEEGTLSGARVVCFDECGPLSLRPWPGSGWFPQGRPRRMRATYRRTQGVRHLFGAYDVGADRLWGELQERKRAADVGSFLEAVRARYPKDVTVYVVMDNLSAHWTPDICSWAVANNVGLVATPTYASHLNRIECHFWAFVEYVVRGSDYPDWDTFKEATSLYLEHRNSQHCDPHIRELENRRKVA
jgi:transposase